MNATKLPWYVALISISAVGCTEADELDLRDSYHYDVSSPGDCVHPEDSVGGLPGAVPNGGDDREAFQRAIDKAIAEERPLCVGPGDWHISKHPTRAASLQVAGASGFEMVGTGPATRLVMMGSGLVSSGSGLVPATWYVIQLSGSDIRLADFAVDGSERGQTGEQTHLVEIDGPSESIVIEDLALTFPITPPPPVTSPAELAFCEAAGPTDMCLRPDHAGAPVLCDSLDHHASCSKVTTGGSTVWTLLGWFDGGDCIRLVGRTGASPDFTDGVTIRGNHAQACARSFVALQRANRNVRILDNETVNVRDQAVDMEPSGTGQLTNITIVGNKFQRGAAAEGQPAVALSGVPVTPNLADPYAPVSLAEGIVVEGNELDGGIWINNVGASTVAHNVMHGRAGLNASIVTVVGYSQDLSIIGNSLHRPAGLVGEPAAVVTLYAVHTGWSRDTLIAFNDIYQGSAGNVITLDVTQGTQVVQNTIDCAQPGARAYYAVNGRSGVLTDTVGGMPFSAVVDMERLQVSGNDVTGNCKGLLWLRKFTGSDIKSHVVWQNTTASGLTVGVVYTEGVPSVTPVVDANLFSGIAPASHVKGPTGTTVTYVGTNAY
jgi:hypothetical protein